MHSGRGLARSKAKRRPEPRGPGRSSSWSLGSRSLEERSGHAREDVICVRRVEINCAVDLEDMPPASPVAGDVDAREIEPERGNRPERELTRCRRRAHTPADSAQRHVRTPFARLGTALDSAHDAAPGDDDA
jgi:hypothetical protein